MQDRISGDSTPKKSPKRSSSKQIQNNANKSKSPLLASLTPIDQELKQSSHANLSLGTPLINMMDQIPSTNINENENQQLFLNDETNKLILNQSGGNSGISLFQPLAVKQVITSDFNAKL